MLDELLESPTVLAAIFTVIGGILLKLVESYLNGQVEKRNARKAYRDEVNELQVRIDSLEDEVSRWRVRAFTAEEKVALLRIALIDSGAELPPDGTMS